MSLLSSLSKNKQDAESDESGFSPRTEEAPSAKRTRSKRKSNAQANEAADPVLPEKKRARRRLIGVVALVLAAVIGLPMILDAEPKPLAEDIVVQIPSRDKPSHANNGGAAAPVAPTVTAAASLDPKEEVLEQPAARVATPGNAAHAAPDMVRTPVAANPADTAPVVKSKEETASAEPAKPGSERASQHPLAKAGIKPEIKSAEKAGEMTRAMAILDGKTDAKADSPKTGAEKKSGKFAIQVAALATREKVNELQGRLKDAGIRSYTEKVATETGGKIRIRIGPFANKEEADRMRARLGKLGLSGTLVSA